MKFFKKISNRYNIVILILIIMMFALTWRLAILNIADGDEYRERADNTRMKNIYTTAPRGEIRDRNGKLLAGSKPSFTVQILKDELAITEKNKDKKKEKTEKLNETLLDLVRFIEEDGADYISDYPIELNVFKYKTEEDYKTSELSPNDRVIEIIQNENLVKDIMLSKYESDQYPEHFKFIPAEKAIYSLGRKGIEVPIETEIVNGELVFKFFEDENILNWKKTYNIDEKLGPLDSLVQIISGDKTVIRKLMTHHLSRKLTYDILSAKNLQGNIIMEETVLSYDEEYISNKRRLMDTYDFISYDTSGEEDFLNLFKRISLWDFLDYIKVKENGDSIVIGEILVDFIREKDKEFPVEAKVDLENKTIDYVYGGKNNEESLSPKEYLYEYINSKKLVDEFLVKDNIRGPAQEQLLKNGVNPKISIVDKYEYTFMNNKEALMERLYSKGEDHTKASANEIFKRLRDNTYIDENLSNYEARSILVLYDQMSKQGHRAYEPINIAYGIKDKTVAKISEHMPDINGIDISVEPIRFYPEGETAAHILGYLGKISQQGEIDKYVTEKGYSPNDIIGKTGIEESFEDYLKGKDGIKKVEVDVLGNTTKVVTEEKSVPGNNIYLSIDLDLQKVAEETLIKTLEAIRTGGTYKSPWGDYPMATRKKGGPYRNATSGATVAVNVKTGEVLAMASYPAYNPNLFTTGISAADWLGLFPEDEKDLLAPRPLYNIATQTAIQPGSTYKMVTALAALNKGFSPTKTIRDMGYVTIGDKDFKCLVWTSRRGTHGNVNVYEALRDSCNYYFYSLALGKNEKTGEQLGVKLDIEDIIDMTKELGLDGKTGIEINIPSEVHGGAPNPAKKIANTKAILKNTLERELPDYITEEDDVTEDDLYEVIEEIISWIDYEDTPSKREVVLKLREMGINSERKVKSTGKDLADIITFDYLNQAGWKMADTINTTIGQGEGAYTPIQLANYIATISNGGYRHQLTLIDSVKNYNNTEVTFEPSRKSERINLNNYNNLEDIKKGMEMVSSTGTARRTFGRFPVSVATKTGTAQKAGKNPVTGETYDDFAEFVAYAPANDPEIAVATIIFQGGSGGNAGAMTRDIIAEYLGFNKEMEEDDEDLPFTNKLGR